MRVFPRSKKIGSERSEPDKTVSSAILLPLFFIEYMHTFSGAAGDLITAAYYRLRAARLMHLAQEATDPHLKAELFDIADRFLKLAEYRLNKRKKEAAKQRDKARK